MLWVADYSNPSTESLDCIIIEANSYDDAYEKAVQELKLLHIPKRYLIRMEEFDG